MEQGVIGLGILGQIQVMSRWENDPVWFHDGVNGRVLRGRGGYPPPIPYRKQAEDREGSSRL